MNRDGMTIRQIAGFCGVDRSTVIRWAAKVVGAERTEIDAKSTEASATKIPATLSLVSVLAIIRAGGKGTLADLLADNAAHKVPSPAAIDYQALATAVASAVAVALAPLLRQTIPARQTPRALPPASPAGCYYTIVAYAGMRGIRCDASNAVIWGQEARRYSEKAGYAVQRVQDDQWGAVNAYHLNVLKTVFTP